MWALYYLQNAEEQLSQQDLIELMLFPKQTINSAVSALVKKGYVTLEMIPNTKNRKRFLIGLLILRFRYPLQFTSDLLYNLIIAQLAVICNEKGVNKGLLIDFFESLCYNE